MGSQLAEERALGLVAVRAEVATVTMSRYLSAQNFLPTQSQSADWVPWESSRSQLVAVAVTADSMSLLHSLGAALVQAEPVLVWVAVVALVEMAAWSTRQSSQTSSTIQMQSDSSHLQAHPMLTNQLIIKLRRVDFSHRASEVVEDRADSMSPELSRSQGLALAQSLSVSAAVEATADPLRTSRAVSQEQSTRFTMVDSASRHSRSVARVELAA